MGKDEFTLQMEGEMQNTITKSVNVEYTQSICTNHSKRNCLAHHITILDSLISKVSS